MSVPAPQGPSPDLTRDAGWQRLDPRMLLIHPLQTLVQLLPAVIVIFFARGADSDAERWELYALPLIVLFGVFRWVTTQFRITEEQVELRHGVLYRQNTTARLEKVRTVDLTAGPHHRVLGLSKVAISTGSGGGDRIELDSLRLGVARELQQALLSRAHQAGADVRGAGAVDVPQGPGDGEVPPDLPPPTGASVPGPRTDPAVSGTVATDEVILRGRPAWARYAPLTMRGLGTAAAIVGVVSQPLQRVVTANDAWTWVLAQSVWALGLAAAAAVVVLAVLAYILSFHGFTLVRRGNGSLHVRRGLVTTRETSLDPERLRGVTLGEPLGLRLGGAASLRAVSSGLGGGGGDSDWLVPPAPAHVAHDAATLVLLDGRPLEATLASHGAVARRRRLTRAVAGPVILAAALAIVSQVWTVRPWMWLVLAVLVLASVPLGLDRYEGLGHAVMPEYLVARSGSLLRETVALQTDGVIGWNLRQSFFQRRQGVATLQATTAAGAQHYEVIDIPEEVAWDIVRRVSPGLIEPFCDSVHEHGPVAADQPSAPTR